MLLEDIDLHDWNMPTSICGSCFLKVIRSAEAPSAFKNRLQQRQNASKNSQVKDATRRCKPNSCRICSAASPFMRGSTPKKKRKISEVNKENEAPQQLPSPSARCKDNFAHVWPYGRTSNFVLFEMHIRTSATAIFSETPLK